MKMTIRPEKLCAIRSSSSFKACSRPSSHSFFCCSISAAIRSASAAQPSSEDSKNFIAYFSTGVSW
ncbi:hypothetical protein E2C01_019424 [Portunus trituberculatus]|uniref:Uncharacterized protein n=1 Tax=Portunus trituberculatus TaxID=210409 RepID=A0A5B7DXV4_PORTR|nr:hypothetical protein [Portunus trituberculatus]